MPTIYVLLILAVLAFVLYVTWRSSSRKSAHSAPKERPKLRVVRPVARTSKAADLPTLDFPTSDARASEGVTHRR